MKQLLYNKYSLITLISLLIFTACKKDYDAPNEFADVSWAQGFEPGELWQTNVDGFVAFMDLSQGTLSHEWTIEKGNYFLNNGFKNSDVLDNFINKSKGLSTKDPVINVLFKKGGLNKVRLHNTFATPVKYEYTIKDKDGKDKVIPVHSVVKNGVNVFDTTFVVDVYAKFIPKYAVVFGKDTILKVDNKKVIYKGKSVNMDVPEDGNFDMKDTVKWPTIDLQAGQSLKYIDLTTTGRPSKRTWAINGGNPATSSDSIAVISYYSLGKKKGVLDLTREYPAPNAYQRFNIPMWVNVTKSTQPFALSGDITQATKDKVISFRVSGEIEKMLDEKDNFVVHVKNVGTGFDADIPVISAVVNKADATIIDLTLKDPIFNTDDVTLEYKGGNITSVDKRVLKAFPVHKVITYEAPSIFTGDDWGFETPHAAQKGGAHGWWKFDKTNWMRNDNKLNVHTGNGSLKFNYDPTSNPIAQASARIITSGLSILPAKGKYKFKFWIYVEPGSDISNLELRTVWDKDWQTIIIPMSTVDTGKWVEVDQVIDADQMKSVLNLFVDKAKVNKKVTFYLDDLELIPLSIRK